MKAYLRDGKNINFSANEVYIMPMNSLKNYLDEHKVHYDSIVHSQTFTAKQTAESAHISSNEMAKTVMIKINGHLAMAVVPASEQVDLELVKGATHADSIKLANELEFESRFPGCEIGAMPPFGNLFEMPVYADESLMENENIAFNAGTHTELIKLACQDFEALEHPTHLKLSAKHTS
jgi:Ala-tRNA(Pro) deacylase